VLTPACPLRPSNSQLKENWSPNVPPSLTKRSGNSTHEWPTFKAHRSYFWNHLLTIGNSIVWTQLNRPLVTYNCLLRSSKCLPNHVTASVMHSSILWWTFVKQHSIHLEGKQVCRDQATFQSKTNQDQVHLIKESVHYHFIAITYCSDLEVHTFRTFPWFRCASAKLGFIRIASCHNFDHPIKNQTSV
jgi:hypothetical protein